MITEKQIEAAKAVLKAWQAKAQGSLSHGVPLPSDDVISDALAAAENAAWLPISEWNDQRGYAIVEDCFGSQPAEFDPDPTLEDFLQICGEGEGEKEFPEYLEKYPGEGWRTVTADEVEYLEPEWFRPIPHRISLVKPS